MTIDQIIDQIRAEAKETIEAEGSDIKQLTLALIVNHRVPLLCKALKVATKAMEHEGVMVLREALTRIAQILGESDA